jgi:DNA mismatch endonuclease (patch repair protein)
MDETRVDPLNQDERSERMSRVRRAGNKSTEGRVEAALLAAGIGGWEKHPKEILGKPDFYFPHLRLVVFVDGCFWHACPVCARRNPTHRAAFWRDKIDGNRRRDNRQRRQLRRDGYHVMRVWEHEVAKGEWMGRLRATIRRIEFRSSVDQALAIEPYDPRDA